MTNFNKIRNENNQKNKNINTKFSLNKYNKKSGMYNKNNNNEYKKMND